LQKARIIIPVWGEKYIKRLDEICIPALLTDGNLPHLAKYFECELVIVTESKSFDFVARLPSIRSAQRWADLNLVAMDDVLSHPNYYGLTITYALYRGFTNLGNEAKNIWCLFLCADFILAKDSYRVLVQKMLSGEKLILAPSYCVIEEEVKPLLLKEIDENGFLSISNRNMAGMILDHTHFTIRAKIINWQMYKIDRVDQFYYLHDNDTLIGRQLPIAVVAFRAELVPLEPVTFWDYGVITEICPTAKICVLGDSDDFLMLELRGFNTMNDQLSLGSKDAAEIAEDLSRWTTKDQRDCGVFDLIVHRKELPSDIKNGKLQLEYYCNNIFKRVRPNPQNHFDHYIWKGVKELHCKWKASSNSIYENNKHIERNLILNNYQEKISINKIIISLIQLLLKGNLDGFTGELINVAREIYLKFFGRVPNIKPLHPYFSDLLPVIKFMNDLASIAPQTIAFEIQGSSQSITSSILHEKFIKSPIVKLEDIFNGNLKNKLEEKTKYDFCLMECTRYDLLKFSKAYDIIRPILKSGGQVLVIYRTLGVNVLVERDFELISRGLPNKDICSIKMYGTWPAKLAQKIWDKGSQLAKRNNIKAILTLMPIVVGVSILSLVANTLGKKRLKYGFNPNTTSMWINVKVK